MGQRSKVRTLFISLLLVGTAAGAVAPAPAKPGDKATTGSEAPEGCDKGAIYQEDCNLCYCSAGGLYTCTKFDCINLPEDKAAGCSKGQSYFDKCNKCTCVGSSYSCTKLDCAPPADKSTGCSKGQSYTDKCNTCACSGSSYSCTKMDCITPPGTGCSKGPIYIDKCNTCTCSDSTYSCTKQPCLEIPPPSGDDLLVPRSKGKKKKCDKGKRYYESTSCSWCNCKPNGDYDCEKSSVVCVNLG